MKYILLGTAVGGYSHSLTHFKLGSYYVSHTYIVFHITNSDIGNIRHRPVWTIEELFKRALSESIEELNSVTLARI